MHIYPIDIITFFKWDKNCKYNIINGSMDQWDIIIFETNFGCLSNILNNFTIGLLNNSGSIDIILKRDDNDTINFTLHGLLKDKSESNKNTNIYILSGIIITIIVIIIIIILIVLIKYFKKIENDLYEFDEVVPYNSNN